MPSRPKQFNPRPRAPGAADAHELDRGSARERGYSTRWDRAARAYRMRFPLCVGCRAIGLDAPADVVDHVIPHQGDQALFWNEGNWQSVCRWHHDVVKQSLEAAWRKGDLQAAELSLSSSSAMALTRERMRQV